MKIIANNIKWIMLVSGSLTCTMAYAAIAPQPALLSTFGATLDGPVAEIIVRNWGVLITLMGLLLLYGAFNPDARLAALIFAGLSKLAFIGLVLWLGKDMMAHQVGVAVVIDCLWVLLFGLYFLTPRPAA